MFPLRSLLPSSGYDVTGHLGLTTTTAILQGPGMTGARAMATAGATPTGGPNFTEATHESLDMQKKFDLHDTHTPNSFNN
jgi:hypothetical protein